MEWVPWVLVYVLVFVRILTLIRFLKSSPVELLTPSTPNGKEKDIVSNPKGQ